MTTLFYVFEHLMKQVARADSLTSPDFGITTRLFGRSWWDYTRVYYEVINYNDIILLFHFPITIVNWLLIY
jgi:hypothetical protein